MQELGPAYIKIAQAASTRGDVVPEPYCNEFAVLQDNVKPFSTVAAREVRWARALLLLGLPAGPQFPHV